MKSGEGLIKIKKHGIDFTTVVAHVYRARNEEEIVRIISATGASKRERGLYIQ